MRNLKQYTGPVLLVLFVLIMGAWHYLDVEAGAIGSGDMWLSDMYMMLLAAGMLLLICLAVFLFAGRIMKKIPVEITALISILVLGSMYMVTLPPISAPDEVSHFASAYALSNRILGGEAVDDEGNVWMRQEDEFIQNIYMAKGDEARESLGRVLTEETWKQIRSRMSPIFVSQEAKEITASVSSPVNTTPAAYLAPALGITLGRLIGVNCMILAFMGRFFNLLFFGIMVYESMKVLPFGKTVVWGVSLLPMSLHLAASYSYDTFLMGMSFFFGSYCIYLAYAKPVVQKRDIAILAVLAAAFGPCKMVYAVMLGFALLIPVKKFGGWKNWTISAGTVLAAFAVSMVLVNRSTIATYASGSDNYVSWAAEEGFSIPLILHNPLLYVRIMYNSLVHLGDEWTLQLFGGSLGNLDPVLSVPFFVSLVMGACLVLLSIRNAGEALYMKGKQKVWICFLAAACLAGLMTAMLVGWTPMSSTVIEGVQGRYLIPVIPFVLMCMKNDRVVRTAGDDRKLIYCMCALDCYVVLRLFSVVSMRL